MGINKPGFLLPGPGRIQVRLQQEPAVEVTVFLRDVALIGMLVCTVRYELAMTPEVLQGCITVDAVNGR
jgi:hypothetical protein